MRTTKNILAEIQDRLLRLELFSKPPQEKEVLKMANYVCKLGILDSDVELLENEIDRMEADLPQMTHFVLPGGHLLCHIVILRDAYAVAQSV
jgi:cob(I)alamin adenosyltransferase